MQAIVRDRTTGKYLYIHSSGFQGDFTEFMWRLRNVMSEIRRDRANQAVNEFPDHLTLFDLEPMVPMIFTSASGEYFKRHGLPYFHITIIDSAEGADEVDAGMNLYLEEEDE